MCTFLEFSFEESSSQYFVIGLEIPRWNWHRISSPGSLCMLIREIVVDTQATFTCSKSKTETLEKDVKYFQSQK